jgi:hypothetical protein
MHLKALGRGAPPEEAAMGGQPPVAGAFALAFVQANRSSTEFSGPTRTSVVRQIARGRLAPSSKTT